MDGADPIRGFRLVILVPNPWRLTECRPQLRHVVHGRRGQRGCKGGRPSGDLVLHGVSVARAPPADGSDFRREAGAERPDHVGHSCYRKHDGKDGSRLAWNRN